MDDLAKADSDTEPKHKIQNDFMPIGDSEITQDQITAMISYVSRVENHHNVMMGRFSWREEGGAPDEDPINALEREGIEEKKDDDKAKPPQKRKRRKKSEPEPEDPVQ
jgi:hypothetical protein